MNHLIKRVEFIQNYLEAIFAGDLHAKRIDSLANGTLGVMTSASLAVSIIGQSLAQARALLTKHAIKQVDRLLSNQGRLGVITRAGDETLRSVLVVGATAVIQHVRRGGRGSLRGSPWIINLLKRKPPKLAAVALANKMARVAWKLMVTGERYAAKSTPAALASAI